MAGIDDDQWLQLSHTHPRELTDEELNLLSDDKVTLSDFKRNKLEIEAQKNWDLFYKRNTTSFYKDRHWTSREFPELTEVRSVTCCVMSSFHLLYFTCSSSFSYLRDALS